MVVEAAGQKKVLLLLWRKRSLELRLLRLAVLEVGLLMRSSMRRNR